MRRSSLTYSLQAAFGELSSFFVLSGFLIGRILINIADRGLNSRELGVFLIRRWMRTLPLYFVWLFFLALIWPPQFWTPDHHAILLRDLPWYLTLTQNLAWPMVDTWYEVSWSLTVEEWFYLLFSCLLFASVLIGRRFAFWGVIGLFLIIPTMLRWHLPDTVDWDAVTSEVVIYRLDAFTFGIIVAWMSMRDVWLLRFPFLLLILGLIIVGFEWSGELDQLLKTSIQVRKTFIFNVASLGCALCLPAALAVRCRAGAWLAISARAISQQSYAIYISHLSLIYLATYYRDQWSVSATAAVAGTLLAIYVLSFLSFRFFETPLLAWRPRQRSTRA